MARGLGISKEDVFDAALLFGSFAPTFSANEFAEFLRTQSSGATEESVDELLSEFSDAGRLRRIGPGIYAKPVIP